MGEEGLEYVDFVSGEVDVHHWLRGTCRYGILPANGLIYVPPHNCGCHLGTLLQGFLALTSQKVNFVELKTSLKEIMFFNRLNGKFQLKSNGHYHNITIRMY